MDATIDWCEKNYVYSIHIAEFWNSISGLFLVYIGLVYSKRLTNFSLGYKASINLVWVGIGTVLFHTTLKYHYQLCDEIPMLWMTVNFLEMLMDTTFISEIDQSTRNNIKHALKVVIDVIELLFIPTALIYPMTNVKEYQVILFILQIITTQCVIVYILTMDTVYLNYTLFKFRNSDNFMKMITLRKAMRNHITKGRMYYISCVSVWLLEHIFCEGYTGIVTEYFISLHSVWHILSGIGITHLLRLMYIRKQLKNELNTRKQKQPQT